MLQSRLAHSTVPFCSQLVVCINIPSSCEERIYERIPPEQPYGSLDALIKAEFGITIEETRKNVQARAVKAKAQRTNSESKQGNQDARRDKNDVSVTNVVLRTIPNADYLTARIARDRPDILERMKAGE